jgi:endothelin-converting enzyme
MLTNNAQAGADRDNFDKLKTAYDACLDEKTIKESGLAPLKQLLDQLSQRWAKASNHADPLNNVTLFLARHGINPFVSLSTGPDDRDPDTVVVSVSPPWSFGLPSKERYDDDQVLDSYRSVAVELLGSIYPDQDEQDFVKVIALEKKLAAASPSTEEREDVTVRPRQKTARCLLIC